MSRLIYRTLTFIKDTPGEDPSIQPDLAESLGMSSDDGRTWTYRLRAGLKYEDGRPITAQDIKYGVMRSFDRDVFPRGATWMPDLLENESGFQSPYATPEKDLTSVETPDDRTLIFHFSGSQSDADWIMSLTYTSPVPKDKDTKEAYDNHPVASGPYKIESYQPGTALALVRNENWDPATDPNRPAFPDRFQFELNTDKDAAGSRLLKSDGNDAFAVPFNGILHGERIRQVGGPRHQASVRQRAVAMCRVSGDEHAKHQGPRCPACHRTRHRPAGHPIHLWRRYLWHNRRLGDYAGHSRLRRTQSRADTHRQPRRGEEVARR